MLHTFFIAKEGRKHDGRYKIQKYDPKGRVMHLSEREQHRSRHIRHTSKTYHQRLRYECPESVQRRYSLFIMELYKAENGF
jgi:hypothetical protein